MNPVCDESGFEPCEEFQRFAVWEANALRLVSKLGRIESRRKRSDESLRAGGRVTHPHPCAFETDAKSVFVFPANRECWVKPEM